MAKNYTIAEVTHIMAAGTDHEAIADIGRRLPLVGYCVNRLTAIAGNEFVEFMSKMPDYLTAGKIEKSLKSAGDDGLEDPKNSLFDEEASDATEETESNEAEASSTDYTKMSAKEMWDLLGKAGKRKLAKSTKKQDLIEACEKAFGAGATTEEETTETEGDEAQENSDPYAGKKAMELYKMCKDRKIKAEPKQKAAYYADLLKKADEEATSSTDEAEDWDDETEEEAPPKKEKKAAKKEAKQPKEKKAAKKEETDDDDDWEI